MPDIQTLIVTGLVDRIAELEDAIINIHSEYVAIESDISNARIRFARLMKSIYRAMEIVKDA